MKQQSRIFFRVDGPMKTMQTLLMQLQDFALKFLVTN
jgi:hypothetical protein